MAAAVALACALLGLEVAAASEGLSEAPLDRDPVRLAAPARVETAARLALEGFGPPAGRTAAVALLARADDFPDALAAGGLAGALDAPVLLTPPDGLPVAVTEALEALGTERVVVLGGEGAVSAGLVDELAQRWEVQRVSGASRYATAAEAAREAAEAGGRTEWVFVATGEGYADALAAAPLAFARAHPVLLTRRDDLPEETASVLDDLGVAEVWIVGGPGAVGPAVEARLRESGAVVHRLAGPTRAHTALAVAEAWETMRAPPPTRAVLARGDGFADALAAGPYAGSKGAPVLLTAARDALGPATAAWLSGRCDLSLTLQAVGGAAAVSEELLDEALRRARVCPGRGLPALFGYRVEVDGDPDPDRVVAEAVAIMEDPHGWSSPARLRFAAADGPLVLRVTDRLGEEAPACAGAPGCRDGDRLLVDAAAWRSAPAPGWQAHDYRRWLVHHLVGRWLGAPTRDCPGSGIAPVMRPGPEAPEGCSPGLAPLPDERLRTHDRYVPQVVVAATGDIHGEGVVRRQLGAGLNPLRHVAHLLAAADVAVVNLETAVGTVGSPAAKQFTFQAPPALVHALAAAGVDVVNLANNHALDYGVGAMFETIAHAREAGLAVVGAGADSAAAYRPAVLDVDGRLVAVVGLSRVLPPGWAAGPGRPGLASAYDEPAAVAAVRAAADLADHVVVSVHWGVELAECPDSHQRRLAALFTEAGADVVAGHHPHILQGVARHGGGLVAYSLGNFVWYHNRAPSRYTGVLTAALPAEGPGYGFAPAEIDAEGSPRPATGTLAAAIQGMVESRSPGGGRCW